MIRSDTEYQAIKKDLAEAEGRLNAHAAKLREEGLRSDQIERVLEPLLTVQESLRDDLVVYDRAKSGRFEPLSNLAGLEECLIGLRLAQGLTQRDLACRLGIHESQVSRDERNRYSGITLDRARRLLTALDAQLETRVTVMKVEFVPRTNFANDNEIRLGAPPAAAGQTAANQDLALAA